MELFKRCWIAIVLLAALLCGGRLGAKPPSIKRLVSAVPVLSPNNKSLRRFRVTVEMTSPFEVPIATTVAWERPDVFGMMVCAGEERAPFWFLSGPKSMMFDVTRGEIMLFRKAEPRFMVEATEGGFSVGVELSSSKKTDINVDRKSLLREAVRNGVVDQTDTGDWRLTSRLRSGKSDVIAVFAPSEPFTLRGLTIRSTEDGATLMSVRDISINDDKSPAWPAFPDVQAFPSTLTIRNLERTDGGSLFSFLHSLCHAARTFQAQVALRNPEWRTPPFLFRIDWANAAKNNAEYGPKLRALFEGQAHELADADEPPAPWVR